MKSKQAKSTARFAYEGLDRVIHERARLSVLTSLITNPGGLSFVDLKKLCDLTDGNLARHLQVLEKDGMVQSHKNQGQGRTKDQGQSRAQTIVRITAAGRKRYLEYLATLEQVVRDAAVVEQKSDSQRSTGKLSHA